ncbi:Acetamidase/Formamidase [Ancylobacter novellus DSM 506]|uniref:Acetamidase/Formamidase n=1 Tax=Ancylobacter novellus (strain ATCC 8093 / DSM 506 / JCM 20403 / CCM 1077 / IAM 12100 / NBRC 12443 / NCIMB 10456) TaxID=639283 RepID=D7A2Z2_ANCN5|nr:acetamidase/formamidase family protein [Ancylobacter novellus]ADH87710.1 Acetamidase/Formamidase [Ancylobacter novellus DSM 506]
MTKHHLPATPDTVHWGYFSRTLDPVLTLKSGERAVIETITHHANDDYERMIAGDRAAEEIFLWTKEAKTLRRRGAGATEGPFTYGSGEGLGVHLLTGPIAVEGAEPGDVIEVRIIDAWPRPSANPAYQGRFFGSNPSANWGFQYKDLIEEPKPREVVTIYELDMGEAAVKALYSYRWTPQTDPDGIVHPTIDYPGVRVDHGTIVKKEGILPGIKVPARLHFGTMGLAPAEADFVSTIPPNYTGGNMDDWRIAKGARMYYPVAVPGGLFSCGDAHASQGDSELSGTAIEISLTGEFEFILHKKEQLDGTLLEGLNHPLLENDELWSVYGFSVANYLTELGPDHQTEILKRGSLDNAMRDAFRKLRRFLMTTQKLSEDEAISLMSVAADFAVTQVVDANWGLTGSIRKSIFAGR